MTTIEIALAGYLAFGQLIPRGQQEIVKHAGLQVIHADGAVTLRLKETGREEKTEGAAKLVVIRMKDEHYPFEVVRYVRSWNDCDAVETWVEVRHSAKSKSKPEYRFRVDRRFPAGERLFCVVHFVFSGRNGFAAIENPPSPRYIRKIT